MTARESAAPRVTVRVRVDGGFAVVPGLAGPFELDTDRLPAGAAETLRRYVDDAHFFALPERIAAPAGAADVRTYTITATAAGRSHTVQVVEPIADPALAGLVQQVMAAR